MRLHTVMVPLDGSALAEGAFGAALDLVAGDPDAVILLMRAAEAKAFPGGDPIARELEVVQEAEEYLEAAAARLTQRGARRVRTSVWYGAPVVSIVDAATANKPDVIVMSTHGRSGFGRLLMGSVAESVLRATHVPILMLRPDGAPVERPQGTARTRSSSTKTSA